MTMPFNGTRHLSRSSPASRSSNRSPSPFRRSKSPSRRKSVSSNYSTQSASGRPANLPQPVRPRSRIESLHKALIGELTPSPFDYTPNHFYVSKGGTQGASSPGKVGPMGRSRRFTEQKFQTPSPLDYQKVEFENGRDKNRRVSQFGTSRRFDDEASVASAKNGNSNRRNQKISPAVGQYNVHESWSKLTTRESRPVMGRSKREGFEKKDQTPDPAQYSPQIYLVPLPGRRASLHGSRGNVSSRRSPSPTRMRPGTSGSPSRRSNGTSRPGSPQQKRKSVHFGSPSGSMSSRRRSSVGRSLSPLRAQTPSRSDFPYHESRKYALSHSLQSKHKAEPAFSFGNSPKLTPKTNDTPPPDRYNSHEARDHVMKRNNVGSMPKAKRRLHDAKFETPSPHQYQTDRASSFTSRKPTAAVFGRHKRQVSNYSSLSKGPGAYERYDSTHNSRWKRASSASFGSAIRDVHRKRKQSTPSSMDYSPNYSTFSKKAPSAILYFTG